jgi:hypothetical protein
MRREGDVTSAHGHLLHGVLLSEREGRMSVDGVLRNPAQSRQFLKVRDAGETLRDVRPRLNESLFERAVQLLQIAGREIAIRVAQILGDQENEMFTHQFAGKQVVIESDVRLGERGDSHLAIFETGPRPHQRHPPLAPPG